MFKGVIRTKSCYNNPLAFFWCGKLGSILDVYKRQALRKVREQISIPLVADVHFDAMVAVAAIENGVDKIRIDVYKRQGESGSIMIHNKIVQAQNRSKKLVKECLFAKAFKHSFFVLFK